MNKLRLVVLPTYTNFFSINKTTKWPYTALCKVQFNLNSSCLYWSTDSRILYQSKSVFIENIKQWNVKRRRYTHKRIQFVVRTCFQFLIPVLRIYLIKCGWYFYSFTKTSCSLLPFSRKTDERRFHVKLTFYSFFLLYDCAYFPVFYNYNINIINCNNALLREIAYSRVLQCSYTYNGWLWWKYVLFYFINSILKSLNYLILINFLIRI